MKLNKFLILFFILFSLFLGFIFLYPNEEKPKQFENKEYLKNFEFGITASHGYAFIEGKGNFTLVSLKEKPKNNVYILNKDYFDTDFYPKFLKHIKDYNEISFVSTYINNSIIIIPSGAMPKYILNDFENITKYNYIIYIGKSNLVWDNELKKENWYNGSERILLINKSITQLNDEDYKKINDYILYNNFSIYSVNKKSLDNNSYIFVEMNGNWLRLIFNNTPYDSNFLNNSCEVEEYSMFPGEEKGIVFNLKNSSGDVLYYIYKNNNLTKKGYVGLVKDSKAVYVPFKPDSIGDYVISLKDNKGTICSSWVHVKDLKVFLHKKYGSYYEFFVYMDGKPLKEGKAIVNIGNETKEVRIINGKFGVNAYLKEGENIFVIDIFNKKYRIVYENKNENLVIFYIRSLIIGGILLAMFYGFLQFIKKPIYRIRVPEGAIIRFKEMVIKENELIDVINKTEKYFGWDKVPLYSKEIAFGLKLFFTKGLDVTEGNVDEIMKKLLKRGIVERYMDLYQLKDWGDKKKNALKRKVRDLFIANGVKFKEIENGFVVGKKYFLFDYDPNKDQILIFENLREKEKFIKGLDEEERARLLIKINNEKVKLITLDDLNEFL